MSTITANRPLAGRRNRLAAAAVAVFACVTLAGCASTGGTKNGLIYGTVMSKKAVTKSVGDKEADIVGGLGGIAQADVGLPVDPQEVEKKVATVKKRRNYQTSYVYTIRLQEGKTTRFKTEKSFIEVTDCVAIERGATNNIRVIAGGFCQEDFFATQAARDRQLIDMWQCRTAKRQLILAQSDGQLRDAGDLIETTCQYRPPPR